MTIRAAVLLALLLFPALAAGQAEDGDPGQVSNDRTDRPLQMPPASSEVREAFDDYERFSRRGAWERAFKALDTIPEAQSRRFVDGHDGFIIAVGRKRRALLAALPPEGLAAYRLFHDDDAKKLLDEAEGANERPALERLFSAYFRTAVGDNAADRLGDLEYERGRFDRAADCWLAILRDYPDTDLDPALLAVKAALALSRAGRRHEIADLRRDLTNRHAEENVTLGGRTATVSAHLRDRLGADWAPPRAAAGSARPPRDDAIDLDLDAGISAAWQMRFAESVQAGMSAAERSQWEANPLSSAVPAVAVAGSRLFADYLGHVFALDLETGKLLWRSGAFHNVDVPARQDLARMIDPSRFAIVASPNYVWSLSRELTGPNPLGPYQLTCRRAEDGGVVWRSIDLPDYAGLDLAGKPLPAGGTLFVTGRPLLNQSRGLPVQYVLAIRPGDGRVLWKTEVGMIRQSQRYYYGMADPTPQPQLIARFGAIFVDTQMGILARIDADSGELDWGFGYPTEPAQSSMMNRVIFVNGIPQAASTSSSSPPIQAGTTLIVKGAQSDRIDALDPDRLERLWERPMARSARLLGLNADEDVLYLGGPELLALDLKTRALLWALRLPGGSGDGAVLVRPNGLWQITPRGIFEVDPKRGRVRRIFRGDDMGSESGSLELTDQWLLAITNRTISAYPRTRDRAGNAGENAPAPATTRQNEGTQR